MGTQLLEMQYAERRRPERAGFPLAQRIIVADGQDAGWVALADLEREIRLVDIMVLSDYRGRGIASAVIRTLLESAARGGRAVRLNVDLSNVRAITLYERLGFLVAVSGQVQQLMEWRPVE